jgi:PAS domain S-box-containing protein
LASTQISNFPMSSKRPPAPSEPLRVEAERRLKKLPPLEASPRSAERLMQELRVHQVELEMQNEALRLAQAELKSSRDRYFDLYELAPVAYLTIDLAGKITEINLAGANLLGEQKESLLVTRFERFIAAEDQAVWRQYFQQMLKSGGARTRELSMVRKNETLFCGQLSSFLTTSGDDTSELRITLVDITRQKNADEVRRRVEARLRLITKREREVLMLALSGMSNSAIAARLQLNQRTVENHRSRIHRKTGVASLLELVQEALTAGVAFKP